MKKNKSKYVPLLCVLLAIPLFTAGAFALNHTDLKGLFTDTKDTTINAGDGEAKKQYDAALKRERMKTSTTAKIAGTKYTWTKASLDKENKDSVASEAFEVIEATNEAVEATTSDKDKTIVVYDKSNISTVKEDGTQKTETEVAQEVVQKAKDDSAANEDVIIAVDRETYEKATETPAEDKTLTGTATDTTVVETPKGDVEIADKFTTNEPVRVDSSITVEIPDGSGETTSKAEETKTPEVVIPDTTHVEKNEQI